jgi:hypothetical protein
MSQEYKLISRDVKPITKIDVLICLLYTITRNKQFVADNNVLL